MAEKKSIKEKKLKKSDYESLSEFRYAIRKFLSFSEEAAERVGLTSQQHQALLAIKGFAERDKITNGELAERLQIKHHSAVGLLNRLEAQDLIQREPSNRDRREIYVVLTERGEALLAQLTAVHQEELQLIAPQLTGILKKLKRVN